MTRPQMKAIRRFFTIPASGDLQREQLAWQLSIHLSGMIVGYTGVALALAFVFPWSRLLSVALVIGPLAVNLSLLSLAKRGRLLAVARLFLLELWLLITLVAFLGDDVGVRAAWGYFIIVFNAGMLLSQWASVAALAVCSLTTLAIAFLSRPLSPHPWTFWMINTFYLLVMIYLQNLAVRSIRGSLAKVSRGLRERQQAQAALLHSEMKHREMIDSLPFCVFEADVDGRLRFVNRTGLEWFGYSPSEVNAGLSMYQFLEEPEIERARENVRRLLAGEELAFHEYRVRRRHGGAVTTLVRTKVIVENDRPAAVLQGSLFDISELRKAEKEREQVISLLKATVESTADGILVVDAEGRIAHSNQRFKELAGIPGEIMVAGADETALAFVRDQLADPQKFLSRVRQLYATPEAESFDVLELKDGRVFELFSRPQMLAGRPVGRVWSFRNVSERKQAEKALIESERRYRALFDSASDAIFLNHGDAFIDCNARTLELFGCSREEFAASSLARFSPEKQPDGRDSREKAMEKVQAALEGRPQRFDWIHRRCDGTLFPAEVMLNRVELSTGAHTLAIVRDVSDHRRLEEQLLQAQKMEAIGILAGGVAHDFNNILSTIVGYGSLLRMKRSLDPQAKEHVEKILDSCERAVRLTSSLLTFSRKQEIELQAIDINDAVYDFHKILARLIGEDIEMRLDLASQNLIVDADIRQIEQVLMNLATNSRDAMPGGGRLTISTAAIKIERDEGDIPPGDYAMITIADSGAGMNKEVLDHIFEPFFTRKERGKGTGLGLAIVYGIVKKHEGFIKVASAPGQGARFAIYLPLKSAPKTQAQGRKEESFPDGGETILLVEDDAAVRQATRFVLEEFGYAVLEAENGQAALERFRENRERIDLVICDLIMPRLNGWETMAAIRRVKGDVKAIFISGYTADIISERGLASSGENLLMKPLNPGVLLNKVRSVLDGADAARSGRSAVKDPEEDSEK